MLCILYVKTRMVSFGPGHLKVYIPLMKHEKVESYTVKDVCQVMLFMQFNVMIITGCG